MIVRIQITLDNHHRPCLPGYQAPCVFLLYSSCLICFLLCFCLVYSFLGELKWYQQGKGTELGKRDEMKKI